MRKYNNADIIKFVVELQRKPNIKKYNQDQLIEMLYHEFPGITKNDLREAIKDVELLLAIQQIMRGRGE